VLCKKVIFEISFLLNVFEPLSCVFFMARTAQLSKEKWQPIITLRHEGQSIRDISRILKVSSSAVAKTIKRYDETDSHEDRHRK
jgi:DNA-binding MarR family transcriptional regulator